MLEQLDRDAHLVIRVEGWGEGWELDRDAIGMPTEVGASAQPAAKPSGYICPGKKAATSSMPGWG
eukprot:scaffold2569_cov55-Phaeocystis_antarctica.AAC.7